MYYKWAIAFTHHNRGMCRIVKISLLAAEDHARNSRYRILQTYLSELDEGMDEGCHSMTNLLLILSEPAASLPAAILGVIRDIKPLSPAPFLPF